MAMNNLPADFRHQLFKLLARITQEASDNFLHSVDNEARVCRRCLDMLAEQFDLCARRVEVLDIGGKPDVNSGST